MPQFKTFADTNLLKDPSNDAQAIAPIPVGTVYSGVQDGRFVKTRIPSISPEEGFVRVKDVSHALLTPERLTPQDFVSFCGLVTWASREIGANRDYLMAVAYDSSRNLDPTVLGGADTQKAGPFQYSVEAWEAALAGVASNEGFSAEDRLDWGHQPTVAALLAKDATEQFKGKFQRLPTFKELYFLQLNGDAALDALATPATIDAELTALQNRLEAAYIQALKVIERLGPEDRLMRASVGDPPWMAVAREQMARGVAEDPGERNTAEIAAYFQSINAHVGTVAGQIVPWCGAFVGYCIKTCGVPAAAAKVTPAAVGANYWLSWDHAPVPPPVGSIVVFPGEHVGFLAEGSTATKVKILGGNQSDRVCVVERDRAGAEFRWFGGIPRVKVPAVATAQGDFRVMAPEIMKRLLDDFEELNEMHAAAILGNLGHECAGFTLMTEVNPIHGGPPGIGWAQWTGSRRNDFQNWLAARGNPPLNDFEGNYSFLVHELKDTFHKKAIDRMKDKGDLYGAVVAFEEIFEVANAAYKHYESRMKYAQIALSAFKPTA